MLMALVVSWTHPIAGREEKALAYGAEVAEFWGKKFADGLCSEPQMFFAEAGRGLWIVTGEREVLTQINDTEEARLLTMKGELLLESFTVETFYAGQAALDYMMLYGKALATIG